MARPLENRVRVNADARPSVVIHAPAPVSVALEDVVIPFHAEVQDDYGATRVAWVRSVSGSRARSLEMPVPESSKKSLFLAEQLSLPALGARAGDVLQLSVEARDANPYLLNMTVSEPVTVHVISEEQYREMLRIRTGVDEFVNKYRLLAQSIADLVRELDRAKKANPSGLSREEAVQLKEKHAEVRKLAEKMAKDFPIFDTDGKLSETASSLAGIIAKNEEDLSGELPGTQESTQEFFRTMRDRLRAPQEETARQSGEAEMAAKIMQGYDLIMEFRRLADSQKETATMLGRFLSERKEGRSVTAEQLKSLGESQKEILALYWLWHSRAPAVISAIPGEAEEFRREMGRLYPGMPSGGYCGTHGRECLRLLRGQARGSGGQGAESLGNHDEAAGGKPRRVIDRSMFRKRHEPGMRRSHAAAFEFHAEQKAGKRRIWGRTGGWRGRPDEWSPHVRPQREKFQQSRPSREGAGEGSQKGEGGDGTATNARHSSSGHKDEEAGRKQEKTPGDGLGSPAMQQVPAFTGMPSGNTLNNTGKTSQNNENEP